MNVPIADTTSKTSHLKSSREDGTKSGEKEKEINFKEVEFVAPKLLGTMVIMPLLLIESMEDTGKDTRIEKAFSQTAPKEAETGPAFSKINPIEKIERNKRETREVTGKMTMKIKVMMKKILELIEEKIEEEITLETTPEEVIEEMTTIETVRDRIKPDLMERREWTTKREEVA